MKIHESKLTIFLNSANKATYANKDAAKSESLCPASHDYHFEQEDLVYHDTYHGARDFLGGEVVYQASEPVWGLNYFGYILDDSISEKIVYDFLRTALRQEYDDVLPVRGLKEFRQDNKRYMNIVDGPLDRFSGEEQIFIDDQLVYRCWYHGGAID